MNVLLLMVTLKYPLRSICSSSTLVHLMFLSMVGMNATPTPLICSHSNNSPMDLLVLLIYITLPCAKFLHQLKRNRPQKLLAKVPKTCFSTLSTIKAFRKYFTEFEKITSAKAKSIGFDKANNVPNKSSALACG